MIRHLTLQQKLLSGFLVTSLITLAVGMLAISKIVILESADSRLYEKATAPMKDLISIVENYYKMRIIVRELANNEHLKDIPQQIEEINRIRSYLHERIAFVENSLISAEGVAIINEFKQASATYEQTANKMISKVLDNKYLEARALLINEVVPAAGNYQKIMDNLVTTKIHYAKILADSNKELAATTSMYIYGILAACLFFSIGLGVLLTRSIMNQLGEDPGYLAQVAGSIANGDLNVTFRAQRKAGGVYKVLQQMVQAMKDKIREAEEKSQDAYHLAKAAQEATGLAEEATRKAERAKAEGMLQAARQLEGVVQVVSSASEELSSRIGQSSRGADEQSGRVRETAAAMEEMNATILEVARNAQEAANISHQARQKAQDCSQIVNNAVRSIETVETQSLAIKEDMNALGRQAEGIGQVMGIIADIADQTNLLALNAAIEAARAGDAGRGFAVVADEVRKLAEKTMTATQEVGQTILGIQEGTRKNIHNVEQAGVSIEEAAKLSAKSGESLKQILEFVHMVNDQVQSIATASEQQSAASEEINHSVEQVATISAETAQAMEQASTAVADLAQQSQALQRLIVEMKNG
ncbi:methyl-accepting chemotaxis protein [Desulfovibrio sp. UIB00]|uniref:methyl-accepting chemotaxis protein n=1 Tax=Desulfovibrio sp. UIB00 TaxID=2804314 RepID=UPI001F11579A|nr:methyl-accepting chemotaxis protein [Desulfovibrio sp. UIB00]MCH5144598.1 methyl-accepting chemotaxis protein [Desulfovibrio sp. UIB00]